jgi:GNAT superfamily N-acetyltransferase
MSGAYMVPAMSGPLQDLADAKLVAAIEENAAEFLLALGRAGGGEERAARSIHWTIGGSPLDYHNAVVRADLAEDEVDAAIAACIDRLRAHGVPGSWHLGPAMRPADLRERLLAHGFVHGGDEAGMAADLLALNEGLEAPESLSVARVGSDDELGEWTRTLATGFGEGPHEAEWVGAMYRRIGLADATPWRHYLARLDGRAVATASLFLAAGVAGVYFVFTVPDMRRRGIGAAVTLAALRDARGLGCRVGVLGASRMGEPVYRRLGFVTCCTIGIYEWRPPG